MHFICILVIVAITLGLYLGILIVILGRLLGPTPYGYCGLKFTSSSAFVIGILIIYRGILSFIYTAILIIASIFFLKYIRKI